MWRVKRFLAEREAVIGIVIFGVLVMAAEAKIAVQSQCQIVVNYGGSFAFKGVPT